MLEQRKNKGILTWASAGFRCATDCGSGPTNWANKNARQRTTNKMDAPLAVSIQAIRSRLSCLKNAPAFWSLTRNCDCRLE